jgi:hypothetical protein
MLAILLVTRAMARLRSDIDADKRKRIAAAIPVALLDRAKAEFESKGGQGWDGKLSDSLPEVETLEKALKSCVIG